jgi:hypothetical protein
LGAINGTGSLREVEETAGGLRVLVMPDASLEKVAGELNATLVGAGIAVHRLEPSHVSLEHRFLEITRRLGGDS